MAETMEQIMKLVKRPKQAANEAKNRLPMSDAKVL